MTHAVNENIYSQNDAPPPVPDNRINFFDRCVTNISSETENLYKFSKYFHYSAIVISSLVFIAAAVVIVASTLLFAPEFMPIVGLGLTFCSNALANFIKRRFQLIESDNETLATIRKIRELNTVITNIDQPGNENLKAQLELLGVKNIQNKAPILAHYLYWKEKMSNCIQASRDIQISLSEPNINPEHLITFRTSLIAKREEAMLCKIQAAFYLGVSFREIPLSKEIYEVIHFAPVLTGTDINYDLILLGSRNLDRNFNRINSDQSLILAKIFKEDGTEISLTKENLKNMQTAALARQYFS